MNPFSNIYESPRDRAKNKSTETKAIDGVLAQLGEHLPYKQGVTGSSPVGPTSSVWTALYARPGSRKSNMAR